MLQYTLPAISQSSASEALARASSSSGSSVTLSMIGSTIFLGTQAFPVRWNKKNTIYYQRLNFTLSQNATCIQETAQIWCWFFQAVRQCLRLLHTDKVNVLLSLQLQRFNQIKILRHLCKQTEVLYLCKHVRQSCKNLFNDTIAMMHTVVPQLSLSRHPHESENPRSRDIYLF